MTKMVEVDDYYIDPDRYIGAFEGREVPHIIHVTFFENEFAKTLTANEMTLKELSDLILKTSAAEKSKLRYLKPAMFGDKPSANNCLRYNDNVRAIFGVATDYDDEEVSFDAAVALIRAAHLRALIYTSPSHTKEKSRWRVIAPTSVGWLPAVHEKFVARLNGVLGGVLAPESFVLSQAYYFGSVKNNPEHRAEIIDGDFIDLRDDLDAGAIGKVNGAAWGGEPRMPGGNPEAPIGLVDAALAAIPNPDLRWKDRDRIGMATWRSTRGSAEGFAAWDGWLKKSPLRYDARKAACRWDHWSDSPPTNITFLTLSYLADEADAHWRDAYDAASQSNIIAPAFSEESLALKFATRHVNELRYVAMWGKWLRWDGTRWAFDEKRETFTLSRDLCREVATTANKKNEAKTIASAKTRAAVVNLAGEDRRLAASIDQWDADPWLLNTPDGVIDLRTGIIREHRPNDYMTKVTAVSPGGSCHLWHKFLDKVTDNNAELKDYLARVSGYALTGVAIEHAMFFFFGHGANGKGVLMSTVSGVIGDYHRTAPVETFTDSSTDRHPTELAMLRGARLVTAVETEEGRRWAESKIKSLTGGDEISARFMRQDFFEFIPQFKLAIAGNHKPGLRSVDEAIRRRVNIIPFSVTIPEKDRELNLSEKLKAEWPGILQWMIEGCLNWQKNGLAPPDVVKSATDDYLKSEDVFQTWIDECCIKNPQASTTSGKLFEAWKDWATARNEFVGSHKAFSRRMEDHGFAKGDHTRNGAQFLGIELDLTRPTNHGPKM